MLDGERLPEPFAHGGQHGVEIRLGAELAGEFDQRAAVVVAVAVEVLVQPLLNPVANGLEQEGGDEHHGDQADIAEVLEILLHQAGEREYDAVKRREHADGGQRIGIAAPEDDVHVHQPVTHNGVGQGERNQRQREHRHLQVGVGNRAHGVGQHVEQGERQDSAEGAVAQPLELLAHDGVLGLAVFHAQRKPSGDVGDGPEHHPDAVQHPAQLEQRNGHRQGAGGEGHEDREQQRRGQIEQRRPGNGCWSHLRGSGKVRQKCRNTAGATRPAARLPK